MKPTSVLPRAKRSMKAIIDLLRATVLLKPNCLLLEAIKALKPNLLLEPIEK